MHMSRTRVNVSKADGGGSSTKIYETPDHEYARKGAAVMHGSFGSDAEDRCRIEVVELHLPGLDIRVCADDVRAELQALLTANRALRAASWSEDLQPPRHRAFTNLKAAVFRVAVQGITLEHLEQIALNAYTDGKRDGAKLLQKQLHELLGLES